MSKYTLLIGLRRSGKTYRAIEGARSVSPRVMVIASTKDRAQSIAHQYLVFATHCRSAPTNKPDAIVIDHVEKIAVRKVLGAIASAVVRDAPIWATAHPPTTARGQKIIEALLAAGFEQVECDDVPPVASGRFAAIAKIISPTSVPQ